jgi:cytochrome c biogenesis protein CcdA/thiol-disulfide isomerase/thioredoxin
MIVLLAFAFLSGVITILSPCILPVLPIVLSGSVERGKARPFGVLAGFVVSFTVFTLALTAIVQALGVPADVLRYVAVVLIVALGLVMIVPRLRDGFELLASRLASRTRGGGSAAGRPAADSGFWGGTLLGFSLGVVWTPCVGPIMASVISLALTQRVNGGAVLITLAYTLGTSIPMLAVMLGGRALLNRVPVLTRNTARIQRGFGVLMILVGVAIGFGWDRRFQAAVLQAFPRYGSGLTAVEQTEAVQNALKERTGSPEAGGSSGSAFTFGVQPKPGMLGDYGPAPPLVAEGRWFNTKALVAELGVYSDTAEAGAAGKGAAESGAAQPGPAEAGASASSGTPAAEGSPPLTMEELRGRVVVVDFWTYSCVNCVRTIPYLKAWYDAYKDEGLVIIGVHTPEFEFEKNPGNVARAIKDLGVDWPVVQDNNYQQWNAYANRYWPAHYFIDAKGRVRYFHFGEGEYEASERVIRALLKEAGAAVGSGLAQPEPRFTAKTPETYLGYSRARGFTSAVPPVHDRFADYHPAGTPGNGEWNLSGSWDITGQYIVPQSTGVLELGFEARNVFLVVQPAEPGGSIEVRVDGRISTDTTDVKNGTLLADESRLYQLVGLSKPGRHLLHLEVKGKLRLFAFTFG